jgi:hypothetical protein
MDLDTGILHGMVSVVWPRSPLLNDPGKVKFDPVHLSAVGMKTCVCPLRGMDSGPSKFGSEPDHSYILQYRHCHV